MPRYWQEPRKTGKRPPSGLKGRDIGLFYRNQQLKRGKSKIEHLINLTIPPTVITVLYNDLKEIEKTGRSLNIFLAPFSNPNIKINQKKDTSKIKNNESLKLSKNIEDNNQLIDKNDFNLPKTDETDPNDGIRFGTFEFVDNTPKSVNMQSDHQQVMEVNPGPSQSTSISMKNNLQSSEYDSCFVMPGPSSEVGYKKSHSNNFLVGAGDYKYGYEDIIMGTFDEKLQFCLSNNESMTKSSRAKKDHSIALYEDYKNMLSKSAYTKMMNFRQKLPTYKKSKELLEVITNNQVTVISGETGCGKSTQVPQIILDDAIANKRGADIKILVTQPRRIAASSLAMRVAEERAETKLGNSVGYAVRLEKEEPRSRGSIMFCTTGILLADLEVNQGLTDYSHVILDEVHERDCHIDISMCMLKKVLKKRSDLKLILMSATIDADTLSAYFDNCPMLHIEGLAYPVKDFYLEDVLKMTGYQLPEIQYNRNHKSKPWTKHTRKGKQAAADEMEKDIRYKAEISQWLEPIKKDLPREVYHTLQDYRIEELNVNLVFELLKCICSDEPGAILVFLPGIGDITKLLRMINDSSSFPKSRYEVYPLHSKLPTLEQHKIFKKPPQHIRKIIIATNIAETSITIDDIVYVIDCGKIKYSGLNVEQNITTLKTEWISQANMRQRRGRAGRCQPGICYHLLTSHRAKNLEERLQPELQRSNLLEPVLAIKRLRLGKASEAFDLMPAPPAESTVCSAVRHLHQLGALNETETLTPLGWHLARLPVHPAAGKLLLLGALFGCLDRAASVAAVWGFKDPFMLVIGKEKEVDAAKRRFAIGEPSDHVAISEAIIQWEQCGSYQNKRNFAHENFLSMSTLGLLSDMKKQLGNNLKQMGFSHNGDVKAVMKNKNGYNLSLFKAIVAASLYPNIATVRWINLNANRLNHKPIRIRTYTPEDGCISLHPSSVMKNQTGYGSEPLCVNPGANWLVYWLKQRSSDLFLIDVTLVYTLPLMFFGELKLLEVKEDPEYYLISISTIKVKCKKETTKLLVVLRTLLDRVLAAKIIKSDNQSNEQTIFEEQVLNAVTQIITAEDEQVEYLGDEDPSESDQSEYESTQRRRY